MSGPRQVYVELRVKTAVEWTEILMAELNARGMESFLETPEGFSAYLPEPQWNTEWEALLKQLQERYPLSYELARIAPQNWNALWESNFAPILIDDFCGVRADFHPPIEEVRHELLINPRMAFGTGHHATTWLMLQWMRDLSFPGKKVLDFGCGTGVLAILAARLGATMVDAVDIEAPAYQNTMENIQLNHASNVQVLLGGLDVVLDTEYDIILANINRNVILASLETLYGKLQKRGTLLISGLLKEDEPTVVRALTEAGFTVDEARYREEWLAMKLHP